MNTPTRLLAGLLLVAGLANAAGAQTRLTVEAGPLFPIGDLGDAYDTSLYVGGRYELQQVNALGQVALASVHLRGAYGSLNLDSRVKSQFEQAGFSTDASYISAGAGARAYSRAAPFFVSVGASYAYFDNAGGDGQSGFEGAVGLGINFDLTSFLLEIEAQGHFGIFSDDNIEFFTLTGGVGLPF